MATSQRWRVFDSRRDAFTNRGQHCQGSACKCCCHWVMSELAVSSSFLVGWFRILSHLPAPYWRNHRTPRAFQWTLCHFSWSPRSEIQYICQSAPTEGFETPWTTLVKSRDVVVLQVISPLYHDQPTLDVIILLYTQKLSTEIIPLHYANISRAIQTFIDTWAMERPLDAC